MYFCIQQPSQQNVKELIMNNYQNALLEVSANFTKKEMIAQSMVHGQTADGQCL
uniref:Uncharacterized protein n=1 Tax=Arion vulgaris TaxID=1028688 RepID=A0A0B6Y084_9EUPU